MEFGMNSCKQSGSCISQAPNTSSLLQKRDMQTKAVLFAFKHGWFQEVILIFGRIFQKLFTCRPKLSSGLVFHVKHSEQQF